MRDRSTKSGNQNMGKTKGIFCASINQRETKPSSNRFEPDEFQESGVTDKSGDSDNVVANA